MRSRTGDLLSEEEAELSEAPSKIPYELIVPGGAIIKKGSISKKQQLLHLRLKPFPRTFFMNKVIKVMKGYDKKNRPRYKFKVRWNVFWSEALGAEDEMPKPSDELTNLLLADDEIQHRNGVANIAKFVLDSQTVRLFAFVFIMSIPFGVLMNTVLGDIPSQVVHWIP